MMSGDFANQLAGNNWQSYHCLLTQYAQCHLASP